MLSLYLACYLGLARRIFGSDIVEGDSIDLRWLSIKPIVERKESDMIKEGAGMKELPFLQTSIRFVSQSTAMDR